MHSADAAATLRRCRRDATSRTRLDRRDVTRTTRRGTAPGENDARSYTADADATHSDADTATQRLHRRDTRRAARQGPATNNDDARGYKDDADATHSDDAAATLRRGRRGATSGTRYDRDMSIDNPQSCDADNNAHSAADQTTHRCDPRKPGRATCHAQDMHNGTHDRHHVTQPTTQETASQNDDCGEGNTDATLNATDTATMRRRRNATRDANRDEETNRPKRAHAAGKQTDIPTCKEIRRISPQPAFLSIADAVIARELHSNAKGKWQAPKHVHLGNMPHGQLLDLTHGLSLVVDRGLDLDGRATVVAADILQVYDHVSVDKCMKALDICDTPWARATMGHQLWTRVRVACGA